MRALILVFLCSITACGARSALKDDDEPAPTGGGSAEGGTNTTGGASSIGGGGVGGDGATGGAPPTECPPVLCEGSWASSFPMDTHAVVLDAHADRCGNVDIVARADDAVRMGPLGTFNAIFVARLNSDGTPRWARNFLPQDQPPDISLLASLATDSAGNLYVAGRFGEGILIGGHAAEPVGSTDVVVVKLRAEDGEVLWMRTFGTPHPERPTALAMTPNDELILAVRGQDGLDLGGGPLPAGLSLGAFSTEGEHRWSFGAGDGDVVASRIAVAPNGTIGVVGSFTRVLQFPGGPAFDSGDDQTRDLFFALLEPNGAHLVSRAFATSDQSATVSGAKLGSDGRLAFYPVADGTIDFGGGPLSTGSVHWVDPGMFRVVVDASGEHVESAVIFDETSHGAEVVTDELRHVFALEEELVTTDNKGTLIDVLPLPTGPASIARSDDATVVSNVTFEPFELAGTSIDAGTLFVARLCDDGF